MIHLENVRRVFEVGNQEVHALQDISLDISAGEYVSIMGPSGSGKSTLLNILGLLDRPTAGKYSLAGREVTGLSEDELASYRREKIGFVFQFFHLIPRLTAAENVELPLILAGVPPARRKPPLERILSDLGIAERSSHRSDQLSGGERQRVAIGRATITQPQVILADEPTGNLDRTSGADVVEILERLNRDGITLIVVTHDPDLGQRARRRIRLVDGRITEDRRDGQAS
jgi:putative ABC transport system ATP-binding protein